MKTLHYFIVLSILLSSCNTGEPRIIRKHIQKDNASIIWYYKSLIGNTTPDVIEVTKGDSTKMIYKAYEAITDVSIVNNNIVIKLFNPASEDVDTSKVLKQIFDYNIVLDSTATWDDFGKRPFGEVER
jgi:hypothetical protein